MLVDIIYTGILFLIPAVILWLCEKETILKKIGPLILSYGLGFLFSFVKPGSYHHVKDIAEAAIILAIPLFLFTTKIKDLISKAPKLLVAFSFMGLAVFIASGINAYFFQDIPFIANLAAGVGGIFTGGTLNLSALSVIFKMNPNIFILINTVDTVVGALYFFALLRWGKTLMSTNHHKEVKLPYIKVNLNTCLLSFVTAVLVVALTLGSSFFIFSKLNLQFIFITLTFLGLLAGKAPYLQKTNAPYFLGNYFILVFCFSLSQLIDFQTLGEGGLSVLFYTLSLLVTVVMLYSFFAKIFKIDKETATLAHIAGIYGAPFVVVYANYLKKPHLILPGIALALIGYTVGTLFGIVLHAFIELII